MSQLQASALLPGQTPGHLGPPATDQQFWDYLYHLQVQSKLCDIELCIREMTVSGEFTVTHSIPAHKLVLTGCSQFFRRCLQSGQLLDMYNFDGVQPQNLQTLMSYVYHQISLEVMMANQEAAEVAQILEIMPHHTTLQLQTSVSPAQGPRDGNVLVVQMQDKAQQQLDERSLNIAKQAAIAGLGTSDPNPKALKKGERILIKNLKEELQKHNIGTTRKKVVVLQPSFLHTGEGSMLNSPLAIPQVEAVDEGHVIKVVTCGVEAKEVITQEDHAENIVLKSPKLYDTAVENPNMLETSSEVDSQVTDHADKDIESNQTLVSDSCVAGSGTEENVERQPEVEVKREESFPLTVVFPDGSFTLTKEQSIDIIEATRTSTQESAASGDVMLDLVQQSQEVQETAELAEVPNDAQTNEQVVSQNSNDNATASKNIPEVAEKVESATVLDPAAVNEQCSEEISGVSHEDQSEPQETSPTTATEATAISKGLQTPTRRTTRSTRQTTAIVLQQENPKDLIIIKPEPNLPPQKSTITSSPYSTRFKGQKRVVVDASGNRTKKIRIAEKETCKRQSARKNVDKLHAIDGTVDDAVDELVNDSEASPQENKDHNKKVSGTASLQGQAFHEHCTATQEVSDTLGDQSHDSEDQTEAPMEELSNIKVEMVDTHSDSDSSDDEEPEIPPSALKIEDPYSPPELVVIPQYRRRPQPEDEAQSESSYGNTGPGECPSSSEQRPDVSLVDTGSAPDESLPYVCFQCNKRFKNSTGLSIHEQWKHGSAELRKREGHHDQECVICKKVCSSYQALVQHMRSKHSSNPYHQCSDCQQYFKNIRDYRSHRIQAHDDVFYHCQLCDISFKSPEGHKIHMFKQHTKVENNHVCSLCGKSFKMKHELSSHVKFTHAPVRAFKCQLCERDFKNKGSLKRHLETYHTNTKTISCPECYLLFKTRADMKAHFKKHFRAENPLPKEPGPSKQDGPVTCTKCNKVFQKMYQWQAHERQVHGEDAGVVYICTMCKKSYSAKNYLMQHIRQAHLPKRHKCQQCLYEFTHAYMLRKHLPKCKGSPINMKPYKCNGCNRYFNLKGNLTRHIRSEGRCRGAVQSDTDYIVVLSSNNKTIAAAVVERMAPEAAVEGSGPSKVTLETLQASEALQQLQSSGSSAETGCVLQVEIDGEVQAEDMIQDGTVLPDNDGGLRIDEGLAPAAADGQVKVDDENLQETLAQISSLKDIIALPDGLRTMNIQKDEYGNMIIEVSNANDTEVLAADSIMSEIDVQNPDVASQLISDGQPGSQTNHPSCTPEILVENVRNVIEVEEQVEGDTYYIQELVEADSEIQVQAEDT